MGFTIPGPTEEQLKTYTYLRNWRNCHIAGGETVEGTVRYSKDLLLSLVLSFIAPIEIQCIEGDREGIITTTSKKTKTAEEINQVILAITLSSYITLAKPVTTQNSPAFTKRWQAALASQNMADIIQGTAWTNIITLATMFQKIISSRSDLRMEIVDRLLLVSKTGVEGAVLTQIKLVWEYSSLKSVQYMDTFIKSHCRALEIPAVLDQAILFRNRWGVASESDPLLPYSRVRDPNCHQELTLSHYPDLYYAAIKFAKANKLIGENFQMSAAHVSTHFALIDKYIRKTASAELGELSEDAKTKPARLGYPVTRPRRRDDTGSEDEDSDEEDHRGKKRRR